MVRGLFGGAITLELPDRFEDVSAYRHVPDNQEVLADATTDESLIVEILEHVPTVSDEESARFFFLDLADLNGSAMRDIERVEAADVPSLREGGAAHYASFAVGSQRVAKHRQGPEAANVVATFVGNVRLPDRQTDVLITMSSPTAICSESASRSARGGDQDAALALFRAALRTFAIVDWGLFG